MEDKKIKAGNVAVGICLFVIVILLVLIVLFFYNSNLEKNKLQDKISELEAIVDEKDKTTNEFEEKIWKAQTEFINDKVIIKDKINMDEIYGFACKTGITKETYEKNTLVAINKKDNNEIPIMEFNSGAYDYYENKLYFYYYEDDIYNGFYMIDLNNDIKLQEIYLPEESYPYLSELEYYNGNLYYSDLGVLFCLDIEKKKIEKVVESTRGFYINNQTDMLYYTNEEKTLCEMNLITKEVKNISENSELIYFEDNKLIYELDGLKETPYYIYKEYDLENQTHKEIVTREWYSGYLGKTNIVRYNDMYIYIDRNNKLTMQTEDGKKQILTDGIEWIMPLSNNKILIEKSECEDEELESYIFDIDKMQKKPNSKNYEYFYFKKNK
ncbi:MAG: hypothetical protein ACI4UE_01665 [Candidatus Scatovivens sp.]